MWWRYLGDVGKFYRTLWLIYLRHGISVSIKIGQVLLKLWQKKFWCVFLPHSVVSNCCECCWYQWLIAEHWFIGRLPPGKQSQAVKETKPTASTAKVSNRSTRHSVAGKQQQSVSRKFYDIQGSLVSWKVLAFSALIFQALECPGK